MEPSSKASTTLPSGAIATINASQLVNEARENPSTEKNYLAGLNAEQLHKIITALESDGKTEVSRI